MESQGTNVGGSAKLHITMALSVVLSAFPDFHEASVTILH